MRTWCGAGCASVGGGWARGGSDRAGLCGDTQGLGARRAQGSPTRHDSAQSKNSLWYPLWEPVIALSKWHHGTIEHGPIGA